jgi:lipopolysaccharide/colanic/teichoic acid biosynthesis glycosyltransferase
MSGIRRVVKDMFDRITAAVLLLFAPVLLAVSLAIVIDSRGGVFYRQKRVGKDGQEFTIITFRTRLRDLDQMLADLAEPNKSASALFPMRQAARMTRVGSLLRRYCIDKLPQLFTVLTGAMSLVGPRPPLPEETAKHRPDMRRLLVKPGVTGLWRLSGRSDLSWDEAVRLDLRYVEDWSLALDTVILWKTFRAALSGQGAN